MRLVRWMLVIAVACVACGGGRPKDPKVALAIAVGTDMGCIGDEVTFTPEPAKEGGTRYHVMCLQQRAIYIVRDGEAVMEAPNSENKHVRKITMKASFAFKCHPAEISVESLDKDRTFGVSSCLRGRSPRAAVKRPRMCNMTAASRRKAPRLARSKAASAGAAPGLAAIGPRT